MYIQRVTEYVCQSYMFFCLCPPIQPWQAWKMGADISFMLKMIKIKQKYWETQANCENLKGGRIWKEESEWQFMHLRCHGKKDWMDGTLRNVYCINLGRCLPPSLLWVGNSNGGYGQGLFLSKKPLHRSWQWHYARERHMWPRLIFSRNSDRKGPKHQPQIIRVILQTLALS